MRDYELEEFRELLEQELVVNHGRSKKTYKEYWRYIKKFLKRKKKNTVLKMKERIV